MSLLTGLGRALDIASFMSGGTGGAERLFTLSCNGEKLTLPVTPWEYTVNTGQGNKIVNISQVGEALIFGQPKLRTISFKCFFPNQSHEYPFIRGDDKSPVECVELLTKWKESKKPVQIVISGESPVDMSTAIMSFEYQEKDGTKDIYYTLNLTEYKAFNTPMANNTKQVDSLTGLKNRANVAKQATTATIKKGRDILDASRKAYGTFEHWRRIAKSNNMIGLVLNNPKQIKRLKLPKIKL